MVTVPPIIPIKICDFGGWFFIVDLSSGGRFDTWTVLAYHITSIPYASHEMSGWQMGTLLILATQMVILVFVMARFIES